MDWIRFLAVVPVLAGSLFAQGPTVLLIVADDLRADMIAPYGGAAATPNLDKLAARGCKFTRATCGYPICHVSRSEIVSGRCLLAESTKGGVIPFDRDWVLWPEAMRQAGWHTVHSGKWHIEGTPWKRGYDETAGLFSSGGGKGNELTIPLSATGRKVTGYTGWTFKTNDNHALPEFGIGLTPDTDARIADGVIKVIHAARGGSDKYQPLFLHVNFTETHDPLHWPPGMKDKYAAEKISLPGNFAPRHPFDHGNLEGRDEMIVPAPRSELDVKRERAVYQALAENLDAQIGRILDALEKVNELARTIVIFTSDQGLALGSHGLMGKQNQYEHTINVPLIVAGPGIAPGLRLDQQCYLRDLYPTVCEMTRLKIPSSVQGVSLWPALRGEKVEPHETVFGYFTDTQRMVRSSDGWKLVWYPRIKRTQLFHVAVDPEERNDLAADPKFQEVRESLRETLEAFRAAQHDPALP
ncbi:MAG TPA: sulfatase-like hydrolase/transferase [Verrucomicrobiaceae bacterium]|jgi:arylsulfatase A-like enzyme